jgi:hypothetical protein
MNIFGKDPQRKIPIDTAVVLLLTLAGCTTARFPLCPAIAEASYQTPGPRTIGAYTAKAAELREVQIQPLSAFAADFTGSYDEINWFTENYPTLVCAFDPKQVTDVSTTYLSCMTHASEWVQVIRSAHPEDLMLSQTHFVDICTDTDQARRRR